MARFAFLVLALFVLGCRSESSKKEFAPRLASTVPVGTPCTVNADCGFQSYCYTSNPDGGVDGGPIKYCLPQLGHGGACVGPNQCQSNICCNSFYDPAVCRGPGCF
jgi:hypothetical protein